MHDTPALPLFRLGVLTPWQLPGSQASGILRNLGYAIRVPVGIRIDDCYPTEAFLRRPVLAYA